VRFRYFLLAWVAVFLLTAHGPLNAQSREPNSPARVRINSIVPKSAPAGAIVTIEYSYYSGDKSALSPTNVRVFFNGIQGSVLSIGHDFVQAKLPETVQAGKVDIVISGSLASLEPGQMEVIFPNVLKAEPANQNGLWIAFGLAVAVVVSLGWSLGFWYLKRRSRPSSRVGTSKADKAASKSNLAGNVQDGDDDDSHDDEEVELREVPEGLRKACGNGTCVLYVGTGLSAQAGLPTWSAALSQFVGQMQDKEGPERWAAVAEQLASGDTVSVVDLLEARGKRDEFISLLRNAFSKTAAFPKEIVRFIETVPLNGVISSALDTAVEDVVTRRKRSANIVTVRDDVDFTALLREANLFVLKLNEIFSRVQLTVTPDQWSLLLDESPTLRTFLGSIASTRTLLFVGASLESIELFFTALRVRLTPSVRHYAIAPQREISGTIVERFLSKYQVELIPISTGNNYQDLPRLMEQISQSIDIVPDSPAGANHVALRSDRIEKLSLTNIGPFRRVDFNFNSLWTVLLGNNGCGKSTVLRAIALALSGDDDQAGAVGGSLLKAGESTGSIRITVGAIEYETKLIRDLDKVRVRCAQVPPLRSGNLLTLGFPAVRGATSGRTEPKQQASFPYARVEDVLPLIRGGLDIRMGDVRQWIVNNYVRSQDDKVAQSIRTRSRAVIDTFFKILDDMVPGFKLQFDSYNTKTYEIMLLTSDGLLPMEYVSQGMNSTIGWVGVLLQRMFEVYGDADGPEKKHALLLIDEIDSHLHPEWQRILVSKIVLNFPNVQVIASTHSPLVVGNLEAGSVFKFTRSDEAVGVEQLEQSFKGFRADQILTADAFGLESSRGTDWTDRNKRFAFLLGKSSRTAEEEEEYKKLESELAETPRTQESTIGRQAANLVDSMLKHRVESLPMTEEQKRQLALEAKSYLEKVSSG
jgi:predicted ATPase